MTSLLALDEQIKQSIADTYQEMLAQGQLVPLERLQQWSSLFRNRFGPERLRALDGESLLNTMHSNGPESMVYWLEFKNDEEFASGIFGGISGGSALKYGVYQRKDNGAWMTGSSQKQIELSTAEAVEIARKHRDQLVVGASLLESLPIDGTDSDYQALQQSLANQAPDVVRTAWCHKYFVLLYPDKVDSYHVDEYERFHLIKLLQMPPVGIGRYIAAGRYVNVARELGISLLHLVQVLNRLNGRPYRIWRIGTRVSDNESIWPLMRDNNCVLIGWPRVGDLSEIKHDQRSKDSLRNSLESQYQYAANLASRKAGEILNFATVIADGDLVLASDGQRVEGIGKVIGGYNFEPNLHRRAPHQRPVKWLLQDGWDMPVSEGLQTTVFHIRKNIENLMSIERLVADAPLPHAGGVETKKNLSYQPLSGIPGKIQSVLERKGQVILYGPPGTGKTYWALKAARDLASMGTFGRTYADLAQSEQLIITGDGQSGLLRTCTFHPSYGYEDFMEGYRPQESTTGQMVFKRLDGIFKSLCSDAADEPDRRFYLLIDEINRGDIPRIFGELLTLLEKDKRGLAVVLPLSSEKFAVPQNVFLIGTMNTADRSIALLDTALRRRFGFIELMPDVDVLSDAVVGDKIFLGPWLSALNERIQSSIGRDARNRQIGHAYLLEGEKPVTDFARFSRILADDIIPLLQEYCYEDYNTLAKILGRGLIDEVQQRIRQELFNSDRRDDLEQALLEPYPDIATSPQAVAYVESEDDSEEEDEVTE